MKPILNKELIKKRIKYKQMKEKMDWMKEKKFIALHVFWLLLVIFFIFSWVIYITYLHDLPSIKKLWNNILPETTVIYDKNWWELYNLYAEENRTYVSYQHISQTMRDAIVSTEDKTFFQNRWFDFKWLVRAGLNYITGKSDRIQWTSTISQQLIKVSFLTSERSLKRKLQEVYLSYQLNSNYSKEKILELYLNKISYWSNAFWIEEASKTFFWKSSKDLWILESSILASIPKWPTYYSPYNHKDRLMGYTYVYKEETPKNIIKIAETENPAFYKPLSDKLKSILTDMEMTKAGDKIKVCKLEKKFFKKTFKIDDSWCAAIDYSQLMEFENSIQIPYDSLSIENPNDDLSGYILEYNTWRKDFVLWRMLEDAKIKNEDYKAAMIASVDFKFKKYTENIKYPYFVFFVKEYLEDKYGKDFWAQGWLRIYTTIDPKLQDKAEELVKKQVDSNKKTYWASNAALISIDNRNWQIISMVWWADYFSDDKWANVNIITSLRQPGSSFKPIVYANAISKKPIWPDTPIYDSDSKFGKWEPDNYDRKFMWLMPIKRALDYSRNIPAIKAFFYGWWEDVIVKFANLLWIDSLKLWASYGWPLAIWTWELKPLELAWAYSVFANWWVKRDITPILRIEDKKWNIIDQYRKSSWKEVFSAPASYIISKILSDAWSRPNQYWNNVLTLKDRKVAAKTGTSNKDVSKWKKKEILPGDLWTAGYTPQITTVVWVGNTDGSPTKWTCDWLNCAAPIWHSYMEFAHIWLEKLDFVEPEWVFHATISKASWRLASSSTPDELKVSSIFAVKPTEYDGWYKSVQVDSLCNWQITDSTPQEAIRSVFVWGGTSPIIDSYDSDWLKTIGKYSIFWAESDSENVAGIKDSPCERPWREFAWVSVSSSLVDWVVPVGTKNFEIRYDSNNPVIKILISVDWTVVKTIPVAEEKAWNINTSIEISEWNHKIDIKALDKYYYVWTVAYSINTSGFGEQPVPVEVSTWSEVADQPNLIVDEVVASPSIIMTNPIEWDFTLSLFKDQTANIRWKISNPANVTAVNVYLNGKLYKILDWGSDFVCPINEAKDLETGTYSVKIEATNSAGKPAVKILELKILSR
ncbi:MAG: 1A family penicillin-binding protein [uncultured bacterium (gcode 4)]|uniref:peptidoglycan glycosyltransferase n=1 Tax=uncultured bacterium (gcode 4) TaxID=1234023 RepID=K2H223_9BACT|nr:MAG: 1A family penicillin-binding protein [uncultured bacterium (gcode 4)]